MGTRHQEKIRERDRKEARQARRVINGIFIGLIVLMFLMIWGYYALFN